MGVIGEKQPDLMEYLSSCNSWFIVENHKVVHGYFLHFTIVLVDIATIFFISSSRGYNTENMTKYRHKKT